MKLNKLEHFYRLSIWTAYYMQVRKARSRPYRSGAVLEFAPALHTNIWLGWKGMPEINKPAHFSWKDFKTNWLATFVKPFLQIKNSSQIKNKLLF